jgi:raffinose/stachyose/melibiose transport system permease protein
MLKTSSPTKSIVIIALALLWLVIAGTPFIFMIQTGFKEQFELLTNPVWALPHSPTLSNYTAVLFSERFFRSLLNSGLVGAISIVLILIISSMAAYVFAKIKFRFSNLFFGLIVAGLVVPIHVTLIPVYLFTINIGLYDTLWALIGPYVAFSIPVSVFILTEFVRQIPRELEEAARIDGCGPMSTFFRIILPLMQPGLVTIGIYNAVLLWNEFVFAFILTSSPNSRTLPLAIWDFQGQYSANIPVIMALLTLATIPLIIAYIVGQEQLVKGITAGAVKG